MSTHRDDRVYAHVSHDEARTASEIASYAYGVNAWAERQNTRNALRRLTQRGLVIDNAERPLRFIRPEATT